MKKRIAFVSGWYTTNNQGLPDDQRFILDCLYKSAKKYFLKNCDVDYIFITNDNTITLDGVKNIHIDYKSSGFWHSCLMKILSLNFLDGDYDYVYVNDTDQIYVNEVTEEDLDSDMHILQHFWRSTFTSVYGYITNIVPIEFDYSDKFWTMGNFFGGKFQIMKDLAKFTEQQHSLYFNENYKDMTFYTMYPEEIFLLKFLFDKQITFKTLSSNISADDRNGNYFLTDYPTNEKLFPDFPNYKLIHNTKKDINILKNVIKHYI